MSVVIHGDAAFSGQGVVYETLGTCIYIYIIVNYGTIILLLYTIAAISGQGVVYETLGAGMFIMLCHVMLLCCITR